MRLDQLIAAHTPYSRKEVKLLLRQKQIKVNDLIIVKADTKVQPEQDTISIKGEPLVLRPSSRYLLLNKPAGYVCATEDARDPTVLELVPDALQCKGLFPAGRLDKDSKGLVLLTTDGALAHRMLAPKRHVPKYYLVRLAHPFSTTYSDAFQAGISLRDGSLCLPAETAPLPELGDTWALVGLQEGKYHQIKRMFAALGNHVEELIRIGIGDLFLPPDLQLGSCMELLDKDLEKLLNCETTFSAKLQSLKKNSSYLINVTT